MVAMQERPSARVNIRTPEEVLNVTVGADTSNDVTEQTLADLKRAITQSVKTLSNNGAFETRGNQPEPVLVVNLQAPIFDAYAKSSWWERKDWGLEKFRTIVEEATRNYSGRNVGEVASTSFNGKF